MTSRGADFKHSAGVTGQGQTHDVESVIGASNQYHQKNLTAKIFSIRKNFAALFF